MNDTLDFSAALAQAFDAADARTLPGSLHYRFNPLVEIRLSPTHACLQFSDPMDVLSSAIHNGGLSRASSWLNLRVAARHDSDTPLPPPSVTLTDCARELGLQEPFVGMMTAASMNSCRIRYYKRDDLFVLAVATTGTANARRAGDAADISLWQPAPPPPGTINIAVVTNAHLGAAARVEALQLIAEAKTAACHDADLVSPVSGLIATGTGTDASAIFSHPDGMPLDYCGKHVLAGEIIGTLVYDVVIQGIRACQSVQEQSRDKVSLQGQPGNKA